MSKPRCPYCKTKNYECKLDERGLCVKKPRS